MFLQTQSIPFVQALYWHFEWLGQRGLQCSVPGTPWQVTELGTDLVNVQQQPNTTATP